MKVPVYAWYELKYVQVPENLAIGSLGCLLYCLQLSESDLF